MKKRILVSSVFICLVFSLSVFAQKGKPAPCSFEVPANLVINPGLSISADGATPGGLYANGGTRQNKISVMLNEGSCSAGDFLVQLNNSNRYMVVNIPGIGTFNAKFANFDRVGTVPITTNAAAMSDFCGTTPTGGYKYDNYGGCGSDAGGPYVRRNVGFDLGDGVHNLRFQYSPIDGNVYQVATQGTAFIKVYHPDANTWQLAPESPEVGVYLTNGTKTSNPIVPFWFTVTRQ